MMITVSTSGTIETATNIVIMAGHSCQEAVDVPIHSMTRVVAKVSSFIWLMDFLNILLLVRILTNLNPQTEISLTD